MRRIVIQRHHNQAPRPFHHQPRIATPRVVQILHLSRVPARQPFRQAAKFLKRFRLSRVCRRNQFPVHRRHTAQIKSRGARTIVDPLRSFGRRHLPIMHQASAAEKSGFLSARCEQMPWRDYRWLYAMDYPYEFQIEEVTMTDTLPLSDADKKKLLTNAETVFSL